MKFLTVEPSPLHYRLIGAQIFASSSGFKMHFARNNQNYALYMYTCDLKINSLVYIYACVRVFLCVCVCVCVCVCMGWGLIMGTIRLI